MRPKPGDKAPDFSGATTDGTRVELADFRGRKLVLSFYPRDDTPGCPAQACSLRDHNAEIAAKGAAILGVSAQDTDSKRRFTEKYRLNFPLLADVEHAVARAYGVLGSGLVGVARSLAGAYERVTCLRDALARISLPLGLLCPPRRGHEVLKLL